MDTVVEIVSDGHPTVIVDGPTTEQAVEVFYQGVPVVQLLTNGPQGGKGDKGDKGDPGTNGTNGTNGLNGISVVPHGTNGNAARPAVVIVHWIGTATPANANPYDFWTKVTV